MFRTFTFALLFLFMAAAALAQTKGIDPALLAKAKAGEPAAEFRVGYRYQHGKGVSQNYAQAALWYRKAAEQNNPSAELNLGFLYANGQGVPQDNAEAYFWFDLAATGKAGAAFAEIAAQDRDKAASHLTSDDLSRAQERARNWFEDHTAKPR
jgi:TPR repeat protein